VKRNVTKRKDAPVEESVLCVVCVCCVAACVGVHRRFDDVRYLVSGDPVPLHTDK
jgi:hypothetical protein